MLMVEQAFAPAAKAAAAEGRGGIIHFEIQPKNINKIVEAQIPVLGDVVASLGELVPQIEAVDRSAWIARCRATKERYPFTYSPSQEGEKLKPQEVVQELDRQAEALGSESKLFLHSILTSAYNVYRGEVYHFDWCWPASNVGLSVLPMD